MVVVYTSDTQNTKSYCVIDIDTGYSIQTLNFSDKL